MVNQQTLAGHWNEVRGKLKEKWGKLSDDDLQTFNGNVDQLIGRIQQKTGETREAVERFLGELADEGSELLEHSREKIQEAAGHMADGARQGFDGLRQGYAEAERAVQQRPGQAVAVAFGVGLLAGLSVALLLRDKAHETMLERSRASTEQFGRQLREMLANILPDKFGRG